MVGTAAQARGLMTSRNRYGTTRRRVAGRGTGGLAPPRDWAYLTGDPVPSGGVWPASEAEAMALPPFGRGVELLANAVAGTAWAAVRWQADLGVAVKWPTQPGILTRPVPWSTPWHYRWAAVQDLILYGNHFALVGQTDWATRRPGYLVPVDASAVGLLLDPEDGRYWYVVDGEAREPYLPELGDPASPDVPLPDYAGQLLHVSAGDRSGEVLGLGALAQYGAWLGGMVAVEAHAANYFAGGALPPAVLSSPQVLTQAQGDDLKAKWRAMVSTREPVILPSGYVLTPVVSNAEEAQLVQSRQWNATEVAMVLGIPTYKLGLQGPSMTYQNIESADIEFVRDSVDRYAAPLAAAFSQWLMPNGTEVDWDYAHRMRADQTTTAQVITTYVDAGILTKDEGRAMIGRPPLATTGEDNSTPPGVPELTPADVAPTPAPVPQEVAQP